MIGHGPSSSHTMGPAKACEYILERYRDIESVDVFLYGSLANTGKGHLTDYIIDLKFKDVKHTITFDTKKRCKHPNTMLFKVNKNGKSYNEYIVSIGGGTIVTNNNYKDKEEAIYPHRFMKDILQYCQENDMSLANYVEEFEDTNIRNYLGSCVAKMNQSIREGIQKTGVLPGNLKVKRKAKEMYAAYLNKEIKSSEEMMAIASFAVAEENASGGEIVIGPTCGAAGVIPGALTYLYETKTSYENIIKGMEVAGLIGILCKTNASVSGAEAGCQAEIGVACSMAAALIATANGLSNENIVQAAEIALEHSLGLTCDPVEGYVQIPCIERCALFALKAKNAYKLAEMIPSEYAKISFDDVVKTMYQTGKDINKGYKETAKEGLAKLFK